MAQSTSGLRSVLSLPGAYDFVQNLLGARASRDQVSAQYVRAKRGDRVVDVGCGTGEMIQHLVQGVDYIGFDLSSIYIASASKRFGTLGRFECMNVAKASEFGDRPADVAIAIGLLHHLDDDECFSLLRTLHTILKPGGRLVTMDPTLLPGQHPFAAFLAKRDRGQNVRSPEAYAAIAESVFTDVKQIIRHDLLRVPYSHCILELTRSPSA